MKKTIALLTAGAACLLFACGGKQKRAESERIPEYVLTYAENQPEDYPTTQGAFYFARLVEDRSDGRIRIQVKAEGEMGAERNVVEQLQFGGLDFARVSLSSLALEEKISELDQAIEASAHDFVKLNQLMAEKEEAETALEEKMERWMYLEDLAARIAEQ